MPQFLSRRSILFGVPAALAAGAAARALLQTRTKIFDNDNLSEISGRTIVLVTPTSLKKYGANEADVDVPDLSPFANGAPEKMTEKDAAFRLGDKIMIATQMEARGKIFAEPGKEISQFTAMGVDYLSGQYSPFDVIKNTGIIYDDQNDSVDHFVKKLFQGNYPGTEKYPYQKFNPAYKAIEILKAAAEYNPAYNDTKMYNVKDVIMILQIAPTLRALEFAPQFGVTATDIANWHGINAMRAISVTNPALFAPNYVALTGAKLDTPADYEKFQTSFDQSLDKIKEGVNKSGGIESYVSRLKSDWDNLPSGQQAILGSIFNGMSVMGRAKFADFPNGFPVTRKPSQPTARFSPKQSGGPGMNG